MWVFTIDIIHQFLVLRFVYNSNDLIALFHIVGADRLIDGSAAVQVINDKMAQLFFFFGDNADPPFYIVVKSEYQKLMNYINREDPLAFITVYTVSDIRYQPKK